MLLAMNGTILLKALKSYNSIGDFVIGGGLYEAVSAFGDIELSAAKLALENVKQARNPQREIELAVGHLQSAHIAFEKIWRSRNNHFSEVTRYHSLDAAIHKDEWICALLAICYIYLSEPELSRKSLNHCLEARKVDQKFFSDDSTSGIANMFLFAAISCLNPAEASEFFSGDEIPIICNEDWPKLVAAIESLT